MLMLSTESIPMIPIGEGSKRAVDCTIELPRGQALSPAFMNPDIIAELVYEHTAVQPTLFVFAEGEDIGQLCSTLQSIKMWLCPSVNTECDVATPEEIMTGDQLHWVGREESVLVEGANTVTQAI